MIGYARLYANAMSFYTRDLSAFTDSVKGIKVGQGITTPPQTVTGND